MRRIGNTDVLFFRFNAGVKKLNKRLQVVSQRFGPFQNLLAFGFECFKIIRVTHDLPQFDALNSIIEEWSKSGASRRSSRDSQRFGSDRAGLVESAEPVGLSPRTRNPMRAAAEFYCWRSESMVLRSQPMGSEGLRSAGR
ncbi:MAG: hypothetical protein J0H25_02250, partial [Rhizobiales bacterium]|nr:hypothetical protein [Hyphomicrobiales bacterium]